MQSEMPGRDTFESADPGWRILLCDDSKTERTSLAQILRREGYEVDEAADGAAALLLLKSRAYDLMLLDLQMPGVDGFDVLAYVQRQKGDLPVVVLSGLPPEEIGDGLQRLPDHELPPLLLKPIDVRQLFQVIELKLAGELP
jgi:CheY-like chemotaxis protein